MLDEYDCGALAAGPPTYNLVEPTTGLTTNRRPYCAQLFNPRCAIGRGSRVRLARSIWLWGGCARRLTKEESTRRRLCPTYPPHSPVLNPTRNIPFGFHHFPLEGAPPGFPVWLDINLSQEGASTWLTWLRDALLLDEATAGLSARAVTYNADLRIFALTDVTFEFGAGGSIEVGTGWVTAGMQCSRLPMLERGRAV